MKISDKQAKAIRKISDALYELIESTTVEEMDEIAHLLEEYLPRHCIDEAASELLHVAETKEIIE